MNDTIRFRDMSTTGPIQQAAQLSRDPIRLAVCVDDFGLNTAIDHSVFELAAQQRISATSCMVDGPAWHASLPALRAELAGRIDLGLHLNLTEDLPGRPARHGWTALVCRAFAGGLDRRWLQREIARQLDAFAQATGQAPDFIDGHRHVHQLPGVREPLLQAVRQRGWQPWWRNTLPAPGVQRPWPERFKAQVIARLGGPGLRHRLRALGLAHNRHLLGVYGFAQGGAHLPRLAAWLAAADDGDLLMCHTAMSSPRADDPIAAARPIEHEALSSPAFGQLLARHGCRVTRLSAVLGTPCAAPAGTSSTQA